VLDLGCGDGRLSAYADVGIDVSLRMLRHAQGRAVFARATATALPFADGTFAAIFSLHVAMHLPERDLRALLAEAHRCLRPGGLLLIDAPSRLRRRLRPHRSDIAVWHAHSAYDVGDVLALSPGFALAAADGLLMLPLHRLPHRLRAACGVVDRMLCRLCRPLASYQLLCLRRD
jgi:SAM-dependent methyltransferase